jgi:DNA-binding PadR family transcriptional regulator
MNYPSQQVIAETIDTQLCEDCDPFTSYHIIDRLEADGFVIVNRSELNDTLRKLDATRHILSIVMEKFDAVMERIDG